MDALFKSNTILVSLLGTALGAFGLSYQANPGAKWYTHLFSTLAPVGTYLLGLYQTRPGTDTTK